jgi:hypothetical protein
MTNKIYLITTILTELSVAQSTTWEPPQTDASSGFSFPPQLWLGDGRSIAATDSLIDAISKYAQILADNDPSLKTALKTQELESLVQRSFAQILAEIDLDLLTDEIFSEIKNKVEVRFNEAVTHNKKKVDLTLGCQLLVGEGIYPITIGPVVFEERLQWLARARKAGRVSTIAARRLTAIWRGHSLRKRKASRDFANEKGILDSVGHYPIVCTVQTSGLSSKFVEEKGLLTARMAMTALSLMWQKPSRGLEWMKLQYDGSSYLRHYVLFGQGYGAGSSSSRSGLPVGKSVEPGWITSYAHYSAEFGQIGEALSAFVNPGIQTSRPRVLNALFLSLWWYHQACRETSDQMATTKFAASMDALTGGHKAKGIVNLIGVRLGFKPDDALMKDSRTTKRVVAEIYDAGRSQLIHGTSANYSHDWTDVRATAEGVGRLCLLFACAWMAKNPDSDDLNAMSLP